MSEQTTSRAELERAYGELMGGASLPPTFIGRRASEIPVRPVSWLWTGRIPLGTLTVLDGDPGLGKSTLTAAITAAVTRGDPLPGDTGIVRGAVVFVSIEDDPGAVIIPRLLAAGADIDQVIVPEPREGAVARTVMLPEDLANLETMIAESGARLVIVDPIMAALSAEVSADRDQDVRRVLAELGRIASATEAAVVIVRHLNKSTAKQAIYRGGGSIGIIGAARSGLLLTKHPAEPTGLLLTVSKSNLGVKPRAIGLRVETGWNGVGVIAWGEEVEISADDALAGPSAEQEEAATELGQAEAWLREALKDGSLPAKQVMAEAEENGFAVRTIQRAKASAGVRSSRVGDGKGQFWQWCLGGQEPAAAATADGLDRQESRTRVVLETRGDLDDAGDLESQPENADTDRTTRRSHSAYKEGVNQTGARDGSSPLGDGGDCDGDMAADQGRQDGQDRQGRHGGVAPETSGERGDVAPDRVRLIVIPGELDWPYADAPTDPDRYREIGIRLMHDARFAAAAADDEGEQSALHPQLSTLDPLPRIGPNGPPAFFINPEDEIAYRKALGDRDPNVVFGVTTEQRRQAEFNPDEVDLETWPGPWCPDCTEEPVEHETQVCPRCIARARDKAARWRR